MRRRTVRWTMFAVFLGSMAAAHSQPYPNKLVRLVVGAPPGSMPDTVPRMLTEKLAAVLGQPVIIDSRPEIGRAHV